jgi:hypothetical protein
MDSEVGGTGGGGSGGAGGDDSGGPDDAGGRVCTEKMKFVGIHVVVDVTWKATVTHQAGSGHVHVWMKSNHNHVRNKIAGTVRQCGLAEPLVAITAIAGGGIRQPRYPGAIWEATSMPEFPTTGSVTGFDPDDAISMNPVAMAVGLKMADPLNGSLPDDAGDIGGADHDGDGKTGITAVPLSDEPYKLPPLDLLGALDPDGDRGDRLYTALRSIIALSGTRDTCDSVSGTATVTALDNRVIGCRVKDNGSCSQPQYNFVDENKVVFVPGSATFEMVRMNENATCADVRAALPEN